MLDPYNDNRRVKHQWNISDAFRGIDKHRHVWCYFSLELITVWFSLSWSCVIQLGCSPSTKINSQKNKRTTTSPRPCTKSSRWGESRSALTMYVFLCDPFSPLFQINFPNNVQTKKVKVESDSSYRILLYRDLRPFWGDSVCSGIDFLVI